MHYTATRQAELKKDRLISYHLAIHTIDQPDDHVLAVLDFIALDFLWFLGGAN